MAAKTLRKWAGLTHISQIETKTTALVLIDIQMEYFSPDKLLIPDGEAEVSQAETLLSWARSSGMKIFHVQQLAKSAASPLFAPGSPEAEFHPKVKPDTNEAVITKALPSSFVGTPLQEQLTKQGITTLIICGLMTHMCVDSTTRDALSLGYKVIVASDACATRDLPSANGEDIVSHTDLHRATLAALADRFADVMDVESIMKLSEK